jgi:hypothetical protein
MDRRCRRRTPKQPSPDTEEDERSVQATLLVLVMVLLAACGGPAPEVAPPHPTKFPPAPVAVADLDTDALIRTLSSRDKIAQLVMPWIPGTYAAYDDEAFARM